jgi:hypothetical protein
MRRLYNGDCERYVPMEATLYYLTEINPSLEGTYCLNLYVPWKRPKISITSRDFTFHSADKSLARPGRKQATATEDFDVHISYLQS